MIDRPQHRPDVTIAMSNGRSKGRSYPRMMLACHSASVQIDTGSQRGADLGYRTGRSGSYLSINPARRCRAISPNPVHWRGRQTAALIANQNLCLTGSDARRHLSTRSGDEKKAATGEIKSGVFARLACNRVFQSGCLSGPSVRLSGPSLELKCLSVLAVARIGHPTFKASTAAADVKCTSRDRAASFILGQPSSEVHDRPTWREIFSNLGVLKRFTVADVSKLAEDRSVERQARR